ncbi:hypothetical protein [Haloplanus natans]|uniref:hypothetical protein n=1 Tax=Haloplanus natans TaxID=376171 RepID=UPI0012F74BAC|nr:hypothetical protein [Haloplanus natans]
MCFKEPTEIVMAFTNGYIPVFENDEGEILWAYDPVRGTYCGEFDDGLHSTPQSVLWPSEFSNRTGWLDVREPPHLIYEPEGTYDDFISGTEREYRTHFVHDGTVLCNHRMIVPSPESEELTPLSEFSEEELLRLSGQMCSNCPDIDHILSEEKK